MCGGKLLGRLLTTSTLSGQDIPLAPDGVGGGGGRRSGYAAQLVALEPRVLFDAAFAETVEAAAADAVNAAPPQLQHDGLIAALADLPAISDCSGMVPPVAPAAIAFVDDQVVNSDDIIASFGPDVEVHIISSGSDGVEQMATILDGRDNISAVHIVSHGAAGSLSLGSATLDAESIAGEHAGDLALISAALSKDADILIYGCDFAAGQQGAMAVQLLASATGADVAASSDITGAAELGGNWTLEVQEGEITTASIAAWDWFSTLASQVINGGGGNAADGSDGLQIHVIDNGQLQIGFQLGGSASGLFQLYHPGTSTESTGLYNGIYLALGNQVTGSDNGSDGPAQDALWGEGGQTLTGSGTAVDPYIVTTTLYSNTDGNASYNPATDVQVVIRTIYVVPNGYFTQEVTVTPPPTNTQVLKYYHTLDTFLAGGDEGPAFSLPQNLAQTNNTVGDPSVVGVRKDPGGPNESFVAFAEVQGDRQFDHWYSAFYTGDNLYGHTVAAGIDGGGDIVNTWDTNPATDNGLGVQFTLGAINTPTTWSYLVTFTSEASIDLDADNSSGATGSSYNTTYTAGSGATIPVADVDAHISNVTGDIQEVRVTLNNMQSGDSLTVNLGALPPGVQVVSQTANEIILGAVGIPQTEATFDAAIQAVGFTSSSSSISVRNIDFAITNELGIEGFASATTIGINQPPAANNDSFTVNEDAILTGNLFANNGSGVDSDPEGDAYTVTAVNGVSFTVGVPIVLANGELTITNAATGTFTFEPNPGYSGPASFTYSITDVEGGVDTATASITVDAINDAPQGSDAVLTATEDTPRAFTAADFGFADPNDSPANTFQSVIITTLPATGTLLLSGNPVNAGDTIPVAQIPNLTWTPPLDISGSGQGDFTFQVVDTGGTANGGQNTDQSPNALSFTVAAVNDPPVLDLDGDDSSGVAGANYQATYIENAPGINIVDVTDVVLTDVDSAVSEIVITLTDGQIGDTLNFPSSMPGGITAAVSPVATLTVAGTMTVTLTGTGATTLANWQAVLASVTFLPSTNDVNNPNPADRHITVQAWDDGGAPSNLATSTIHVTPQNDPPTLDLDDNNSSGVNAGNVGIAYMENGAAVPLHSIIVTSDLDDTDYDAAQVIHTNPQAGDVISINGTAVSAGDTGSVGPVSYSVSVNLGGQLVIDLSGTATLTQYTAALQAVSFSSSSENPPVIQRDITFQISDGTDLSPLRHAFVTVTAVNDAPVGSPIPQQSGLDSEALSPLDVSGYFTDPDSPTLTYSLAPGAPVWLSINATTGIISGTPPLHASTTTNGTTPGTWDVTVVATDGGIPNLSDNVSLTYVITNPAPVAQPDQLNATEGTVLSGVNVFSNNGSGADSDVDGDSFTVTQVDGAALNVGAGTAGSAGGLFTIGSNGALSFTDNGDFEDLGVGETRDTTITYQITDADGGTSAATLTVTVTGSNDPPVVSTAFADPASVTDGNTGFTFNGASAFTDPDGDMLSYSLGAGAPSWLTINPVTGVVSIVGSIPADASQNTNIVAGSDGTYNVQVIATDPSGGTIDDTFMMTVTNLAPVAQDDAVNVGEDDADATGNLITGPGADSDTAPDSDPLTVVAAAQGSTAITIGSPFTTLGGGVLTLQSGGGYTFVPGNAYNGLDVGETAVETISYTVDDGNGGQDTAVLVITITGANDAPVPVDPGNPGPDPENPIPANPATIIPVQTADDGEAFMAGSPLVNLAPYIVDPDAEPVTFSTLSTLPAGLTLNSDGTVTGTIVNDASQSGDPGSPGVYTVLVDVTDGTASVQLTLTIDVSNLVPVAADDTASVGEDAVNVTGNVISGPGADIDTAPDSDPLTVVSAAQGANVITIGTPFTTAGGGVLTLQSGGGYSFVPGTAYNGLDVGETATETITYTVSDGNGGEDMATLTITIQGANDGPVVIDPSDPGPPTNPTPASPDPLNIIPDVTGSDGTAVTPVNVANYIVDPDGEALNYAATGLPDGLTINPLTGVISGTLAVDASQGSNVGVAGTYLVTVTATDPDGASVQTTITYTIGNPAPVAVNDAASASEDGPGTSGQALGNDDDAAPDNDPLHVVGVNGVPGFVGVPVEGSAGGTFIVNADGTWSFDPGADFQNLNDGDTRETIVTYTVSDGQGGTSTATITVTVDGSNDAPIALGPIPPQSGTDGATITPINAGAEFDNPTSLPLAFTATGLPEGLSIDPATGIITGTLENDASVLGPYVINVTAAGPNGETASIPVLLNVGNPAPVASADGAGTAANAPVTIAPLGNDSDLDGDTLTVSSVSDPANGSVVINPDGTVTYTPDTGFVGTDTFTYTVSDGQGGTDTETVTITVGPPGPDAPTGTSLADAAGVDGSPITPISTAAAFADPNGDPLTFAATGLPPGLVINPATGEITGSLPNNASASGPYLVNITAIDPDGNQVTLPLVIVVSNPPPVADEDTASTAVDTPVMLNPIGNDTDPDGDALLVSHVTTPGNGSVIINADGTLTYTPNSGFTGTDSFTYTVSDGQGGTDIATVTLNVGIPTLDMPEADAVSPQAATDGASVSINVPALGNVSDPNGDPLIYSATGLPEGLSIDPNTGLIAGTLPHDASAGGPYMVQVFASDPDGNTVGIPFLLTVSNPAPVADDDVVETPEDSPVITAVLGNDTDVDGDPLSVTSASTPTHGTVSINPNGSITYTPTAGYVGPDSFTYTISDGNGGTSTATVTLDVGPVDTFGPPTAIDPIVATDGTIITPFTVTGAFGDPDAGAGVTYAVDPLTLPPGILFSSLTGTFSGTAENDASQFHTPGEPTGTYIVPVTATDGDGEQATVFVTFTFSNLAPVALDDQASDDEDATQSGNVLTDPLTGDADMGPDTDDISVTALNGQPVAPGSPATITLTHGTLVMESDGTWDFTPNDTANALPVGTTATETVTYTIDDGNGGTDTATLEIELAGANDAPFGTADLPDQRDYEGEDVEIDVSGFFDDLDSTDVLTFSATGLPQGLSIDRDTGIISGTPAPGSASNAPYLVSITVDDGNDGTFTMTFEWRVDLATAPPLPPGGPPPTYPPLSTNGGPQDTEQVISSTVNGLGELNGTPELTDYVITRAVEGINGLNSSTGLSNGDDVITRLVAWAGQQGRDAGWMFNLLDDLDRQPYAGDGIDLALVLGGKEVLSIRTLLREGAFFVGIDELGAGVEVVGISGPGGASLPDNVAVIDAQTLVINVRPDQHVLHLRVTARDKDGNLTHWLVMVNPETAEVSPSTGLSGEIANLIDNMRNQLAAAPQRLAAAE